MLIIPAPRVHSHWDESFRAGTLPMRTVGEAGFHGRGMTGVHGAGVKSTGGGLFVAGFVGLLQSPKVGMLSSEKSVITDAGMFDMRTVGLTDTKTHVVPKEHINAAVLTTACPIISLHLIVTFDHYLKTTSAYSRKSSFDTIVLVLRSSLTVESSK